MSTKKSDKKSKKGNSSQPKKAQKSNVVKVTLRLYESVWGTWEMLAETFEVPQSEVIEPFVWDAGWHARIDSDLYSGGRRGTGKVIKKTTAISKDTYRRLKEMSEDYLLSVDFILETFIVSIAVCIKENEQQSKQLMQNSFMCLKRAPTELSEAISTLYEINNPGMYYLIEELEEIRDGIQICYKGLSDGSLIDVKTIFERCNYNLIGAPDK